MALPLLIYLFPFVTEPRHGSEGTLLANNTISMSLALSRSWQLVRKWTLACVTAFTNKERKKRKADEDTSSVAPHDTKRESAAGTGSRSRGAGQEKPPSSGSKDRGAYNTVMNDDSSMMGPLTVAHLLFLLLILVITDLLGEGEHRFYWGLLYLLLPTQLLVLYSENNRKITHSFSYCMFYAVVLMRQPDYLGHVVMHYFKDMQATSDEVAFHSHGRLTLQSYKYMGHLRGENGRIHDEHGDFIRKELSPGLHVVVSLCFLLIMSVYLRVLNGVVARMGKPFTFPRFFFMAQLYYYLFWYLLLSKYSATTALFYALLLLQHTHITLLNTGLYVDLVRLLKQLAARMLLPRRPRRGGDVDGSHSNNTVQVSIAGMKVGIPMDWIVDKKSVKAHAKEVVDDEEEGAGNGDMSAIYSKLLQPMFFNIELAEQDNLADMTAIVSVSVLVSMLSLLGEEQFTKRYIPPRDNILDILWSLILMLCARFGSSRIVRFIMNFKARLSLSMYMCVCVCVCVCVCACVHACMRSCAFAISMQCVPCVQPLTPAHHTLFLQARAAIRHVAGIRSAKGNKGETSSNGSANVDRSVSYWIHWEHKKLRRKLFNGLSDSYVYFVLVSLSCMFACFQQLHTPVRYSFCVPIFESP